MTDLNVILAVIAPVLENIVDSKIKKAISNKPSSTSVLAKYAGTDSNGKQWVVYDGTDVKAPISWSTIEAAEGDRVSVTISNGRAVMDSNLSNPSAGVIGVEKAAMTAEEAKNDAVTAIQYSQRAYTAAINAQTSAESASASAAAAAIAADDAQRMAGEVHGLAEQAQVDADAAKTAADDAKETAEGVEAIAEQAQIDADAAKTAADDAQSSANAATRHLSDVERVVGTVNWIAEHGRYVNQAGQTFDVSKVYYTRSGSGTELDPYVYAVVAEPVAADIASYYLLVVDESVQNYVNSHLWVDSNGLNVASENDETSGKTVTTGWRIGNVFEMLRNGVSWFKLWVENNVAKLRLGREDNDNIVLTGSSFSCMRADGSIGAFIGSAEASGSASSITDTMSTSDVQTITVNNIVRYGFRLSVKPSSGTFASTAIKFKDSSGGAVSSSLTGTRYDGGSELGWLVLLSGSVPAAAATVSITYQSSAEPPRYLFGSSGVAPGDLGEWSMTEGRGCSATGNRAHAEGFQTVASASDAHSEGIQTVASAAGAHAEGDTTTASNGAAHSEGFRTTASGWYSHAEGRQTVASGSNSHAEGGSCVAEGADSHAEGASTGAYGSYSHSQGLHTVANKRAQTVLGTYNLEDESETTTHPSGTNSYGKYAAIIGNGRHSEYFGNALAVRWDGLIDIGGYIDTLFEEQKNPETAYPTFARSSWSTSSDESTLPVTPCFVLDTTTGALYWCDGTNISQLGYLPLSGGTMTGEITMQSPTADRDGTPPSENATRYIYVTDKDGEQIGLIGTVMRPTSGRVDSILAAYNEVDGTMLQNAIYVRMARDGTRSYQVDDSAAFRDAINALSRSGDTMTGVLNMGNKNIEDIERVFAHYHVMTVSGVTRGNIYVSGDYLYIQGYDNNGTSTCQYRFNLNNFGIAYREYANSAWGSWTLHIYDATTSRTKNTFLAAPSTADGAATFRAISTLDLPNVSSMTATTSSTSAPYSYTFDMSAHAMYSLNMTSTVSIPNSTWVEVVRIRFTNNASSGTLYVKVRWGTNTTGQRYIGHNVASSTSGLEAPGTNTASCVSYPAPALRMSYTYPVGSVAAGTYMGIYVYQNSGAALNIGQVFVRYMASAR